MAVVNAGWLPVIIVSKELVEPVVNRDACLVRVVVRERVAGEGRIAPIAELTKKR